MADWGDKVFFSGFGHALIFSCTIKITQEIDIWQVSHTFTQVY